MAYEMAGHHHPQFNHRPHEAVEREYSQLKQGVDKLYDQARSFSTKSQEAYQRGDGALAKQLSEEAKRLHAQAVAKEANISQYVFTQNNNLNLVKPDEIDLHGQRVDEIGRILGQALEERRQRGMTYVHIIVGQGHHSKDHIPKIKPAVEQLCTQRGYNWRLEENEGRIYVELPPLQQQTPPLEPGYGYAGQQQGYEQQQGYGQQQQTTGGYQSNVQQGRKEDDSLCPCCTVM